MGVTGAGKSSFLSLLCDSNINIGHDLESCTTQVEKYTCTKYSGRTIHFVDTPGFDDTKRSDTEVLRELASWLTRSYEHNFKLNGILYFHRISDVRMQGSAKKNLTMFKKLCGDGALKNVILVTTMWDRVSVEDATMREKQLIETPAFWGWMMSKGSKTCRHDNTLSSAESLLGHFLPDLKNTITLEIQQEMVEEKKTLDQTGAGKELTSEIARERERFTRELSETKEQLREAMAQRDQESETALREVQSEYESKIQRLQRDQEQLMATVRSIESSLNDKLNQQNRQNRQFQQPLEAQLKAQRETAQREQQHAIAESTKALRDELDALKRQRDPPPMPVRPKKAARGAKLPLHPRGQSPTTANNPSPQPPPPPPSPPPKTVQQAVEQIPRWDLRTGQTLEAHSGTVRGLAFSPDSQMLASCSEDHMVRLWHSTGAPFKTLTGHKEPVRGVVFGADGKRLASCSEDKTIRFWDLQGEPLYKWTCPEAPWCIALSPDGQLVASGSAFGAILLLRSTGELIRSLGGHSGVVCTVAFSPDGRFLASGGRDKTVRLFNLDEKSHQKLKGHSDTVFGVAFSSNGALLASCSYDRKIILWDPIEGKVLQKLKGHSWPVWGVAFSPSGNLLASCSWDCTVRLWDLGTMATVQILQQGSSYIYRSTFSPDGRHLAHGDGKGKIYLRTLSSS